MRELRIERSVNTHGLSLMRCNARSVNSTLRAARALNDPYGSNELNLPLADRYSAGVLDMGALATKYEETKAKSIIKPSRLSSFEPQFTCIHSGDPAARMVAKGCPIPISPYPYRKETEFYHG